jgi:uncharacterized protein
VTGNPSIRDRASAALRQAMKERDTEAVAALRTLLAEFGNAEAMPAQMRAGAIEESPGLGAAEVERRVLTEAELTAIAVREHDEMAQAAASATASAGDGAGDGGSAEEAARWRHRQEVVARLLGPG